ncbi:MAG: hypothetical protein ACKOUU_04345 [Acinetobacter tjernbergiae]
MFKFLKKIFCSSEPYINTAEILVERQALEQIHISNIPQPEPEIVDIPFIRKSLDELLQSLRYYDGYARQRTLEHLKDCYEQELFPALLFRLSDYVEINRELAAQHIQRWSQRPEFAQLSIDHFLQIAAVQQRVRTVPEVENLLLNTVAKNKDYLQHTVSSEQGQLPRVLLTYIVEHQWVEQEKLLELSKAAKDQIVRKFWLDHITQNESAQKLLFELKHSQFRDVQYHLFDVLYQRKILNTEDIIELWHSRFLSVMDYAYFALRQQNFDFGNYFNQHPIALLSSQQAKIRAYQWVLFKGEQTQFFEIVGKIEIKSIANALVLYALKQNFIQFHQYLDYFALTEQKLLTQQFFKAKAYSETQPTLSELEQYLQLLKTDISFEQRLDLTQNYDLWDQVYWFVTQQKYVQTEEERQNFDDQIKSRLHYLHYKTYPPSWTAVQKDEMKQHLPNFEQKYPEIFNVIDVKRVLEKYFS